MKTAITIILGISLFLYVSGLTITTNPFRISLPTWYRAVALILIVSGLILYSIGEYVKGYKDCQNKYSEMFDRVINKLENHE